MKKCLVTGCTGLIGSNLVKQLNESGWFVYGLSRHASRFPETSSYKSLPIDLTLNWTENELPTGVDAVIHLAQSEHFREFPQYANEVFAVNVLSTLKLLTYAQKNKVNKFILASSGGVYESSDDHLSEDTKIWARKNLGFYLGTKLSSEILAENFAPLINVVVLRFFFVYGPGQRDSMLIPRLVRSVQNGKPITLQGHDGLRCNPTYVSDAVAAIMGSLQLNRSEKINVGGPEVLSLRQIAETIGSITKTTPKFEIQKEHPPQNLVADITRMSCDLKGPEVKFETGIRSLVTSMKKEN